MLIVQFANWQFGIISWRDERISLVDDKKTLTSQRLLCMALLQALFSLTSSLFKSSSSNWEDWEFGYSSGHMHFFFTQTQQLQRSEWSKQNWQRKQCEHLNGFQFSDWLVAKFFALLIGDLSVLKLAKIHFSPLFSPFLPTKYATMLNDMIIIADNTCSPFPTNFLHNHSYSIVLDSSSILPVLTGIVRAMCVAFPDEDKQNCQMNCHVYLYEAWKKQLNLKYWL